MLELLLPVGVAAVGVPWSRLRVPREYERGVIFRLGRLTAAKGPGLIFLLPLGVERRVRTSPRIVAMDIPPQDVLGRLEAERDARERAGSGERVLDEPAAAPALPGGGSPAELDAVEADEQARPLQLR